MSRSIRSVARSDRTPELTPDGMPVLARGKHRSPRQGACFMEFASFLAGERWSDRPSCTDPALASLARLVNDRTADTARGELAPLIPSVIGLRPESHRTELTLAVRAAAAALPIASEGRQRVLAVAIVRCRERLAQLGVQDETLDEIARVALDQVPAAEQWARRHLSSVRPPRTRSDTPMCDAIVGVAVAGIAEACVSDPDERLGRLLSEAIDGCRRLQVDTGAATGVVTSMPVQEARGRSHVLA